MRAGTTDVSTEAVLLEVALIVTFSAGILYWVFVTPKREEERWRKEPEVAGGASPSATDSPASREAVSERRGR